MKRVLASVLAFGLVFAGAETASAQRPYPPIPPPRYERIPPPPGGRFMWEPGHWHWTGAQYAWIPGRYVPRHPHRGHYVPGHWQFSPRAGQYVWRPAHWG